MIFSPYRGTFSKEEMNGERKGPTHRRYSQKLSNYKYVVSVFIL
ncbi:hypothetical protein B4155_4066 [Bacillus cereus]|nr:hypothetical protein B4155_4066 [Bacillus cereus]